MTKHMCRLLFLGLRVYKDIILASSRPPDSECKYLFWYVNVKLIPLLQYQMQMQSNPDYITLLGRFLKAQVALVKLKLGGVPRR